MAGRESQAGSESMSPQGIAAIAWNQANTPPPQRRVSARLGGAGGGNRTRTPLSRPGILSPA